MADEVFEILPPGAVVDVDEELADEERARLPFEAPAAAAPTLPPLGSTPAYDFVAQQFTPEHSGGAQRLRGLDTLRQWCEKCILTRRGESPAVDPSFGVTVTPFDLLDGGEGDDADMAEALDDWTTALLTHPRISEVADWSVDVEDEGASIIVACTVTADGMADPVALDLTIEL